MLEYAYGHLRWIVLLPIIGAVVNGLFGHRLARRTVTWVALGSVAASFVLGVLALNELTYLVPGKRRLADVLYTWVAWPGFGLDVKLLLDPLSAIMVLIITGIGFLIHLYSSEYMAHDDGYHRYFAYLNLFVAMMLILVLGANLPMMFVGWEGVGLCSYLLIGFWFKSEANAAAGRKAFITNRIGDLGFLFGIFLVYNTLKTLDFQEIQYMLGARGVVVPVGIATAATTLLFVGAMGKSAQIPLYVWLPDAMAGPTPVSALIHAATMVTAGVYMICRLNALYVLAPATMALVAGIGAATALFAAAIAVTQTDIKKVLAYSTVSQLGFMFVGVGVGAFTAGFFHLLTHACFKALLFLGSGSVIHAMDHAQAADDPQDIRSMGGLLRALPLTGWTFAVGTAAIAGVPALSGFFSKDEILWKALASAYGSVGVWLTLTLAAVFTAFYMTRLFVLTFLGEFRGKIEARHRVHESGWRMTVPLVVLAGLSVVAGYIGLPHIFHLPNLLEHWLLPVFRYGHVDTLAYVPLGGGLVLGEGGAMILATLLAFAGMGSAWWLYAKRPELVARWAAQPLLKPLYTLSRRKFFVDEIYEWLLIQPLRALSEVVLYRLVDRRIIDAAVEGSASAVRGVAATLRMLQAGNVTTYIAYVVAAAVVLAVWLAG